MPRIVFPVIKADRTYRGSCPVCGRPSMRSRSFEQTVNPFNCHADRTPKTPAEIREAVEIEADAWSPDFRHSRCAEVSS